MDVVSTAAPTATTATNPVPNANQRVQPPSGIDIIKLKAVGENREIHFRVRTTTKLGKLKKSYCKRVVSTILIDITLCFLPLCINNHSFFVHRFAAYTDDVFTVQLQGDGDQ